MRILTVNKFFHLSGGAERYMFDLIDLLQERGHEVVPFSMQHEKNRPSPYAGHFLRQIDLANPAGVGLLGRLSAAGRIVYSREARCKMRALVHETRPDLAHIHSICYQITPSILYELRALGVPVVQTVHEFKLVCPNQRLFNLHTGKLCEKCAHHAYYHAVVEKCIKNSRMASLLGCIEGYTYHLARTYQKTVDAFVAPSRFLGDRLLDDAGIEERKLFHIPYFLRLDSFVPAGESGRHAVFIGRLSAEKGLYTLLRALRRSPDINMLIVGDGPERAGLEAYASSQGMRNVDFRSWMDHAEMADLVRTARFVVVPSEWHENSPLVIYESFAWGRPVIGSNRGGISELVEDGIDGLIFEAGNAEHLEAKMRYLWSQPRLADEMGRNARAKAERDFSAALHYQKVSAVYSRVVA